MPYKLLPAKEDSFLSFRFEEKAANVPTKMIKKITPSEGDCIIYSRRPLGLFYLIFNGIYVGIDNTNGNAWTEEFTNLRQCKRWLRDSLMLAPSMEYGEMSA